MDTRSAFFGRIFLGSSQEGYRTASEHTLWGKHWSQINRQWVPTAMTVEEGHGAAGRGGSLFAAASWERAPSENASWRLCLKMQHHVRTLPADGSCLLPHSIMRTQLQGFWTALLALGNPLPQSREDLAFPLAQCLVVCVPPSRPSPGTK